MFAAENWRIYVMVDLHYCNFDLRCDSLQYCYLFVSYIDLEIDPFAKPVIVGGLMSVVDKDFV